MSKLPSFKPREIERILLRNGFLIIRQTGSHRIYYNPKTEKVVAVPFHSKDVPRGTVRSIIKQSDLPKETFLKRRK